MAELWFFTRGGKQAPNPVTRDELRRMARDGTLRSSDLVWREGMSQWIRAGTAPDLFVGEETTSQLEGRAGRRERGPRDDRLDPNTRETRRIRPSNDEGLGTGAKIAIILGAVAVLVGLLVGGVVLIVNSSPDPVKPAVFAMAKNGKPAFAPPLPPPPPPLAGGNVLAAYTVNLVELGRNDRRFQFNAGTRYQIKATPAGGQDIDIFIDDAMGNPVAQDDRAAGKAELNWTPTKTGFYKVEVENLGPGNAVVTVNILSFGGPVAVADKGVGPGAPPVMDRRLLPTKLVVPTRFGTRVNDALTFADPKDPGRPFAYCKVYQVNMVAGKTYVIDMEGPFDPYLRLEDGDGREMTRDDDGGVGLNSKITYLCPRTGMYRIYATSCGGNRTGGFTLTVRDN